MRATQLIRWQKFMKKVILVLISIVALIGGCITNGISMRLVLDPETKLSKSSKVFIDPYRNTEIIYREHMARAIEVAQKMGLEVVDESQAEYIIYLNYRKNVQYNASRDEFEQHKFVRLGFSNIKIGGSVGVDFGIINAGVFKRDNPTRSHWEGSIEVRDINKINEVDVAFEELFSRFAENFRGEVQGAIEG